MKVGSPAAEQPVLIVTDVESSASANGAVALWIGPGTVAHFRNLVVTPSRRSQPGRWRRQWRDH